jgi:hypothetical protein
MTGKITGDFGELIIEVDRVEVTSNLPRPDPAWRYTDEHGHEHYWENGYPTLTRVNEEPYWCEDCNDEHTDSHFECPICGETVSPGSTGPSGFREFIPGLTSYRLNGQPISKERADEIVASLRRAE